MSDAQRSILRAQLRRVEEARAAYEREMEVLGNLAIMLDPRVADPNSGVRFDMERLEVRETEGGS